MTDNYVPQNTFGVNRFNLIIPRCPMLSFLAQQVTIPDQSIGEGEFGTRRQNIAVPGEKIEYGELQVTANMDEYWLAFEEVNSWHRGISSPYTDADWGDLMKFFENEGMPSWLRSSIPDLNNSDQKFVNSFSTAEIQLKTNHNNTFALLNMEYIWPATINHQDLQTQSSEGMEPNAFSVTFKVHEMEFCRLRFPWS